MLEIAKVLLWAMSDLVKRLRGLPLQEQGALCEETADRIERLEAELVLANCRWWRSGYWCTTIDCKCIKANDILAGLKDE